jgi:hypothetical protein
VIVSNAVILAETGKLRIAGKMEARDTLLRELATFRLRLSKAGNEQFDAERGSHDDLVLSLASSTWSASHAQGANWIEFIRRVLPEWRPDEPLELAEVVPITRPKSSVPIDQDRPTVSRPRRGVVVIPVLGRDSGPSG